MTRTARFGAATIAATALLILLGTISTFAIIPQSEHDALMALYNATGGPSWTVKDGWGGALGSEATWANVILNGDESHVVVLLLGENNLNGTLPADIGNLNQLTYLDLSANKIRGEVPTQIGNLVNLERLYLNNDQLTGALPSSIGSLTKLKYLSLNGNVFAGAIPSQFQSLVNLVTNSEAVKGGLDLRYNALFTTDPALKSFLDSKQSGGNWWDTQTLPPTGLTVDNTTESTVDLSWNQIGYTEDEGGYNIFLGSAAGGPYTLNQTTPDKLTNSTTVVGLANETTYYFVVQSFTSPHTPANTNTVTSTYSSEVSARTGSSGPTQLQASVGASVTTGQAPLSVNFSSTVSGGTPPYTISWNFGDGSTSADANPSHTYNNAGTFPVAFVVTDTGSPPQTVTDNSISITVTAPPPCTLTCSATGPTAGQTSQQLSFTATATPSHCQGTPAFTWSFGDGNISTEQNPTHVYATEGLFTWNMVSTIEDKACPQSGNVTIVTPPIISSMAKQGDPFRIVINGLNFKTGVKVFINGTEWTNVQMKSTAKLVLKGGSSLKAAVPKNTSTQFKVKNPDNGEASMTWQWP